MPPQSDKPKNAWVKQQSMSGEEVKVACKAAVKSLKTQNYELDDKSYAELGELHFLAEDYTACLQNCLKGLSLNGRNSKALYYKLQASANLHKESLKELSKFSAFPLKNLRKLTKVSINVNNN